MLLTTKIQICGFFHQNLLKNEEFLREEIRVFVPQYACEQSTGRLTWLRLQRVVEENALSYSYGLSSHDDVGVPKQ